MVLGFAWKQKACRDCLPFFQTKLFEDAEGTIEVKRTTAITQRKFREIHAQYSWAGSLSSETHISG